jgi:hypothetical protein
LRQRKEKIRYEVFDSSNRAKNQLTVQETAFPRRHVSGRHASKEIAPMQYQLILQFQGRGVDDFEDLIHLEDTLIIHLNERHLVEGHNFGDDTMNIFIRTDSPESAFGNIRELLHHSLLDKTKAACRRSDETDFTVIWPENYEGRFEL